MTKRKRSTHPVVKRVHPCECGAMPACRTLLGPGGYAVAVSCDACERDAGEVAHYVHESASEARKLAVTAWNKTHPSKEVTS